MSLTPFLKMEQISKRFPGVQALSNVDFDVNPGEILGFIGENGAGKSTLIKILSGVYTKDDGNIFINGNPVEIRNPQDAKNFGISTIYQELALFPHLTVAENIFLNREPRLIKAIGMVDFKTMETNAQAILNDLGVEIDCKKKVSELTVAAQQMVEIAKAVSQDSNLILMDEPTSALSNKEAQALFSIIRKLQGKGVSVVFISHRLEEILSIVDRIIVIRDGRPAGQLSKAEATEEKIIQLMVGRTVSLFPKVEAKIGEPVLELRGVSGINGTRKVSFTVHRGEIVGLAGLIGAGRTEAARIICGVDSIVSGQILIEGKPVQISSPTDAVRLGIGWVPEDRKRQGLILDMDVKSNTTLTIISRISTWLGFILSKKEQEISQDYVHKLSIATSGITQTVGNLSGGNQQKVVLAKWLSSKPKLLIMDEPTRGIDVGAKAEVHALMSQLAQEGMAILMISSEMPEIIGMSDRVIVMCQGCVKGEFERKDLKNAQEAIMACATDFLSFESLPAITTH
jgi:ribose transport system ATP-binding protein